MRKFALRIGAVDAPNLARKVQKEPVPYLGGVAIVIGVFVATYATAIYENKDIGLASTVLIPAAAMALMGLIDDLRGLQPWPRLIAQSTVGILVSIVLIFTNTIGTPTGNTSIDFFVTTFWIVGLCNSINFFDNIDGGASGAVLFSCLFIFAIAFHAGQIMVSALSIVVVGATAGFLIWNKAPAKIYMGDAGALFLGIVVAVLTIKLDPNLSPNWLSLSVPFLLLALPILDTSVAVFSRLNRNLSPFTPGRDHLSHRLIRVGFDRRCAVFALWGMGAFFGLLAFLVYLTGWQIISILSFIIWILLFVYFYRIPHEG